MVKRKILVVDDEIDFLEMIRLRLEANNYSVVTAMDGKEALEKFKKEKPVAVLLDILMPGMDGIATLKEIRKLDKKIPVIMFTAYPDTKVLKGTESLGISALIPKLSTYSDVQASLKSTIDMLAKNIWKKE